MISSRYLTLVSSSGRALVLAPSVPGMSILWTVQRIASFMCVCARRAMSSVYWRQNTQQSRRAAGHNAFLCGIGLCRCIGPGSYMQLRSSLIAVAYRLYPLNYILGGLLLWLYLYLPKHLLATFFCYLLAQPSDISWWSKGTSITPVLRLFSRAADPHVPAIALFIGWKYEQSSI